MSNIKNFLDEFAQRSGMRGKFNKRLFAGMLAGFQAAELDLETLRKECEQREAAMRQELAQTARELAQLTQENAALREQLAQVQAAIAPEGAMLQNLEVLNINMRSNNAQIAALQSDNDLCKVKLTGLERRQRNTAPAAAVAPVPAQPDSDYDTMDYFDFENHFRGSIEHIKEAQRMYLPYFEGKQRVLDIGCGRGEFLSLLKEEGISAKGVDVYEPYVDHCRMQGLSAECGDGIAYLSALDSVDGIFAGQVVEHLKTEQITALCNAAYEKLTEGGCIVIETPNPTSLAIYTGAFYIDPSHVKPVHPLTLQYFLEKAGFRDLTLLYPEQSRPDGKIPTLKTADDEFNAAMQQVSDLLFGSQDYAIVAVK